MVEMQRGVHSDQSGALAIAVASPTRRPPADEMFLRKVRAGQETTPEEASAAGITAVLADRGERFRAGAERAEALAAAECALAIAVASPTRRPPADEMFLRKVRAGPEEASAAGITAVPAGREETFLAGAEGAEALETAESVAVQTVTAPAGLAWSDAGIVFLRDKLKLSTEEIAKRTGRPRRAIVQLLADLNAKGLRPGGRP